MKQLEKTIQLNRYTREYRKALMKGEILKAIAIKELMER